MREFVFLFRSTPEQQRDAMGSPERAQRSMQVWLDWIRELETSGQLKSRGQPLEPGGRVVRGKSRTVTDGPFAEAKDIVLGFLVVQARDTEHAAEIAGGCPLVEGGGSVEVRPVMTMAS